MDEPFSAGNGLIQVRNAYDAMVAVAGATTPEGVKGNQVNTPVDGGGGGGGGGSSGGGGGGAGAGDSGRRVMGGVFGDRIMAGGVSTDRLVDIEFEVSFT